MTSNTVELHFIDGPLAGTRKIWEKGHIDRNRTYRYLHPTSYAPEELVPNNTANTWVKVVCIEYHYLPFRLPSSYNGPERFAMLLEKGLN